MISYHNDEYTVGWICALPLENLATKLMFDREHAGRPAGPIHPHDKNAYRLGEINGHFIVMAGLPKGRYGTHAAGLVAAQMQMSFTKIQFAFLVGIGGGIPSQNKDIRLGDVVVGTPEGNYNGIAPYGRGKMEDKGFRQFGNLGPAPQTLLNAVGKFEGDAKHSKTLYTRTIQDQLNKEPYKTHQNKFRFPGTINDVLFRADYSHDAAHANTADCKRCNFSRQIKRPPRTGPNPVIHHGTIASGDQVVKNASERDRIGEEYGAICIEMEAAGLEHFPSLSVRGICDYADSHKNKMWQDYAAITASAYVRELLYEISLNPVNNNPETAIEMPDNRQSPLYTKSPPSPSSFSTDQKDVTNVAHLGDTSHGMTTPPQSPLGTQEVPCHRGPTLPLGSPLISSNISTCTFGVAEDEPTPKLQIVESLGPRKWFVCYGCFLPAQGVRYQCVDPICKCACFCTNCYRSAPGIGKKRVHDFVRIETSSYLLPNELNFGIEVCGNCTINIVDEVQFRCAVCPDFIVCSDCSTILPDDSEHGEHGFETTLLRTPDHVRIPKTTSVSLNGKVKEWFRDELGSQSTTIWLTLGSNAYEPRPVYVSITKSDAALYFEIKGRAIEKYSSVQFDLEYAKQSATPSANCTSTHSERPELQYTRWGPSYPTLTHHSLRHISSGFSQCYIGGKLQNLFRLNRNLYTRNSIHPYNGLWIGNSNDFPGFEHMGDSLILFLLNQHDPSSLEVFPLNISSSNQIKEIEPIISLDTAPHPINKYHGQPLAAFVNFEEYLTPEAFSKQNPHSLRTELKFESDQKIQIGGGYLLRLMLDTTGIV